MKLIGALALSCGIAFAACDTPTSEPIVNVPLPGHPFGVVNSHDGCWLFVSLPAQGIAVLHRDNGLIELKHTVKLKGQLTGMVLTHDGKQLILAAGDSVQFLDVGKLTSGKGDPLIASISREKAAAVYVNVTANDRTLFVSNERAQSISVVDLEHDRTTIGVIPVGRAPIALTFSKDEKYLYTTSQVAPPEWGWPKACKQEGQPKTELTNPEGAVIVVEVARAKTDPTHSVVARVPAACSPVRLAMTPEGDRIYVTARNSNAVLSFDTAKLVNDPSHARLSVATVGTAPVPVIVAQKKILVGNSNRFDADQSKQQMLDVLDADPLAITAHIPAGSFPREMRLSPDGNTLFLTNFSSDTLQIVDLKRR